MSKKWIIPPIIGIAVAFLGVYNPALIATSQSQWALSLSKQNPLCEEITCKEEGFDAKYDFYNDESGSNNFVRYSIGYGFYILFGAISIIAFTFIASELSAISMYAEMDRRSEERDKQDKLAFERYRDKLREGLPGPWFALYEYIQTCSGAERKELAFKLFIETTHLPLISLDGAIELIKAVYRNESKRDLTVLRPYIREDTLPDIPSLLSSKNKQEYDDEDDEDDEDDDDEYYDEDDDDYDEDEDEDDEDDDFSKG